NTAGGNLVLRADSTGRGTGTVNFATYPFATAGRVDYTGSTGTISIYYNPTQPEIGNKYNNPTNFACSGSCPSGGVLLNPSQQSQLAPYMLVNSASDLQLVSGNLAGRYALGRSFSASGFTGYAPGTTFTGVLDGNGGLTDPSISDKNYIISNLNLSSSS